MYTRLREIDSYVLADIQKYEEMQLAAFRHDMESLCSQISKLNNWRYTICVHRWIDGTEKRKKLDGYTATLQVDFMNAADSVIQVDEDICSFFENITYISYNQLRQKYLVFQNEKLVNIRTEIRQLIQTLEQC